MSDQMQMTLLQIVQSILSSADSDEVNSISDTTESMQAARCVEQTFWNMMGRYDMPEHNQPFQLTSSGNPLQPTLMNIPSGITRIESIRYFDTNPSDQLQDDQFGSFSAHDINTDIVNTGSGFISTSSTMNTIVNTGTVTFTIATGLTVIQNALVTAVAGISSMTGTVLSYNSGSGQLQIVVTSAIGSGTFSAWNIFYGGPGLGPGYVYVPVITFDEFMNMNQGIAGESNVGTMQVNVVNENTGETQLFNVNYFNNFRPSYCTIVSNSQVWFDAYDNTQDSTLQKSKTLCYGWVYPTFSLTDGFVPVLQAQQFPLLLNDAKALFFFENKNYPHTKAEEEVGRQLTSLMKWKTQAGRAEGPISIYFNELPNFGRR